MRDTIPGSSLGQTTRGRVRERPRADPSAVTERDSHLHGWRAKGREIIFEADTRAGNPSDVALIGTILLGIAVVRAETVADVPARSGPELRAAEWVITILLSIEYVLRLLCVERRRAYARSFFGIIDLLAVLPTWISVIWPGTQALVVNRVLRLLRIFRLLKSARFVSEASTLRRALTTSTRKILVFVFSVLTVVIIVGALMYLIEGPSHGFTSIPVAICWTVVNLTTVGYGDIAPPRSTIRTPSAASSAGRSFVRSIGLCGSRATRLSITGL